MPRLTLIEFRRGTAAKWTAANPTLYSGEMGFETDTGYIKIGDGATAWNALVYVQLGELKTLGDTLYADAAGKTATLPGNVTAVQKFLAQTGNGSVSDAPSWQTPPAQGSITYYLSNTASAVGGYLKQLIAPYTPKTTLTYGSISTTPVVLKNWVTDPGFPSLTFIPAGQFQVHIHAANTGPGNATIYGEIWECDSSGVDIAKIGTSETSYQESGAYLNNSETEYRLFFVTSEVYNMASVNSRLVLRMYGVMAGGTHSLELYIGQSADSHISLPSATVDATNFVPYTGATQDVDLGSHNLITDHTLSPIDLIGIAAAYG